MTDRDLLDVIAKNIVNMQEDIKGLNDGQVRLESQVGKLETRMETEVIDKLRVLFDARNVQNDVNERLISALDRIEGKIDVLQLETAHIRRII